tara:strand:+ start:83 stop:448 length:366 start_codon:yes stop_codon:yes gene_type:complete
MIQTIRQSNSKIQKTLSAEIQFIGEPQTLTVTSTAQPLSTMTGYVAPPVQADYVLIEVQDAANPSTGIRYGFGSTVPTTIKGIRKFDRDVFDIEGANNILTFQAIIASTTVYLNVQFGIKQ